MQIECICYNVVLYITYRLFTIVINAVIITVYYSKLIDNELSERKYY